MAALWMGRCVIKTLLIDKRDGNTRAGHADGIQCRTLEILESFGIVDRILRESCHVSEVRRKSQLLFWKRRKTDGRSNRMV